MCLGLLAGCSKVSFVKETHKRDSIITRQFDMLTCEKPYGKIHVETLDENEAKQVIKFVDECIADAQIEGNSENNELFFIKNPTNDMFSLLNVNTVVIPLEPILSGEIVNVKTNLIYLMSDCDYWVAYGMASCDEKKSIDSLRGYYGEQDNCAQLNLSGVRFFDLFQDQNNCEMVKETAKAIVKFAKKKGYSSPRKITEEKNKIINEWLNSLELDYQYQYFLTDNVKYITNSKTGSLDYILIDNLVLDIAGDPYSGTFVRDIDDMEDYLAYISEDIKGIQDYFIRNNVDEIEKTIQKKITCHKVCAEKYRTSFAQPERESIVLLQWNTLPHEYVHILFNPYFKGDCKELKEGMAEYLGTNKYNHKVKEMYYAWLNQEDSYYAQIGEEIGIKSITSQEDLDIENIVRLILRNQDVKEKVCRPLNGENEEWTYEECSDFVAYIIKKYSFGKILEIAKLEESEQRNTIAAMILEWEDSF